MSWILLIIFCFLAFLLAGFVTIARKGRTLRKNQPLPPKAEQAYLEAKDGDKHFIDTKSPFYVGKSRESDVILTTAVQAYEICIFHHRKRFAFQTPSGIPGILVNGEEQLAGYLFDGDVLTIAGENFTFKVIAGESVS